MRASTHVVSCAYPGYDELFLSVKELIVIPGRSRICLGHRNFFIADVALWLVT